MAQVAISFYVIAAYKRNARVGIWTDCTRDHHLLLERRLSLFRSAWIVCPRSTLVEARLWSDLCSGCVHRRRRSRRAWHRKTMQGLPQCTTGGSQPRSNRTAKPTATRCAITFSH